MIMVKLTYITVGGERFAGCTTITAAAKLVGRINLEFEGHLAALEVYANGPLVNPRPEEALAALDRLGLTRVSATTARRGVA
jgi:hypothetical protein